MKYIALLMAMVINISPGVGFKSDSIITKEISLPKVLTIDRDTPPEPSEDVEEYSVETVCSNTSTFKSYMDYRKITNRRSSQYKYQQEAYTSNGYRMFDDRYMVAMAGYPVGTKLDIKLSSGEELKVIIGDVKAGTLCEHPDGSMIEFIVDTRSMDPYVKRMGNYDVIHKGTIEAMYKL